MPRTDGRSEAAGRDGAVGIFGVPIDTEALAMAIWSAVIDGTRHIDNGGFTRCGKVIPFGTATSEDPRDAKADGKLCKTCYATVDEPSDEPQGAPAQVAKKKG